MQTKVPACHRFVKGHIFVVCLVTLLLSHLSQSFMSHVVMLCYVLLMMVMIDAKNRELIININIHTLYIQHTYIHDIHHDGKQTQHHSLDPLLLSLLSSSSRPPLSVSPLVLRLTVPAQLTDCKETVTSPSRGE